ncbi:MAG TPA: hypothetical protein VIP11_08800, partial [Gemmatimonadaceae bacterium]
MSAPPRPAPVSPPPLQPERNASPRHFPGAIGSSNAFDVYLAAIRARLRIVLGLPIAFALVALALSLSRSRMFEARAAFIASEPQSLSGSLGALSSVASQLGVPALSALASSSATGSAQFYGDLLLSNAIAHDVVTTTYDATATGEYGGKPFKGTFIEYSRANAKTDADKEVAAIRYLGKTVVKVSVDRPTGIVRFTVRTKNRVL